MAQKTEDKEQQVLNEKMLLVAKLLAKGYSFGKIEKETGINASTAYKWSKKQQVANLVESLQIKAQTAMEKALEEDITGKISTYAEELELYRSRQRRLAAACLEDAIKGMKQVSQWRDLIDASVKSGEISPIELVKVLPGIIRANAAVAQIASDAEASALGVDKLLEALYGAKDKALSDGIYYNN